MTSPSASTDWHAHLLDDQPRIAQLLERTQRVAVLGIKTAASRQPAFFVPEYMQRIGIEIIPVPVYYPDVTEILGEPVYRRLADVPGAVDVVDVFRRPQDIPQHVDDMLALRPRAIWFQLGIRNDEAAERLARAGIDVVQDHCMMVELRRIGR